jgi:hypothetical protein
MATASSSSQLLSQDLPPAFSEQNPRSGLFAGSSHVDAGRDQYNIKVEMKVCL